MDGRELGAGGSDAEEQLRVPEQGRIRRAAQNYVLRGAVHDLLGGRIWCGRLPLSSRAGAVAQRADGQQLGVGAEAAPGRRAVLAT